MSSFVKSASPYSSPSYSYGTYGAANINPYASYFGPQAQQQHIQPTSPPSSSSSPSFAFNLPFSGGGNMSSNQQHSANIMSSPLSPSSPFNPNSFGSATSPFAYPGQLPGTGGNQYFIPQPAQTRIIGGVNNSSIGVGSPTSPINYQHNQSLPRYSNINSYGYPSTSPTRSHHDTIGEPMHYSPIHTSPQNIGVHNNSPTNTIMLPSYLLGLDQPYSFHQSPSNTTSPGALNASNSAGPRAGVGPASFMSPSRGYGRTVLFEPSGHHNSENEGNDGDLIASTKPKGPPIHGFGSIEGSSTKHFLESPLMKESYVADCTVSSGNTPTSPNSVSTSISTTPKGSGNTWVTVFGFPAGASSFIVDNFSTLGKIQEVKCTPGSNWLHLRFSNSIEARRALSKNGKVLGRSIMVGVILSDSAVVREAEKTDILKNIGDTSTTNSSVLRERNVESSSDVIKSRIRPLAGGSGSHQITSSKGCTPPRSLSQMPSFARESLEVERSPDGSHSSSFPTASTGMFTKAMEYMFGW